ncbi:hypothetical protein NC651_035086 [Populus alba x Populus x berolinensis]|nr:hypothetical protein NC651_035086 [Populus alba x Populus x berolinensis]
MDDLKNGLIETWEGHGYPLRSLLRRPENENVLKAYPFRDNRIESPVAMGTREPPSSLAQGNSVQDPIIIA